MFDDDENDVDDDGKRIKWCTKWNPDETFYQHLKRDICE